MDTALRWRPPPAEAPAAAGAASMAGAGTTPEWLDAALLAPQLRARLLLTAGLRCTLEGAAPTAAPAAGPPICIATLDGPAGRLELAGSAALVAGLIDLLFAGSPTPGGDGRLAAIPPGSASWTAAAKLLAEAVARAVVNAGGPALAGTPTARPLPAVDTPADLRCRLVHGSLDGELALTWHAARAAIPAPAVDPRRPAEAARARRAALDISLPVTLQVAECRLPLAAVTRLQPGDVLPIEQPAALHLLVDGRPFETVRPEALEPPAAEEER